MNLAGSGTKLAMSSNFSSSRGSQSHGDAALTLIPASPPPWPPQCPSGPRISSSPAPPPLPELRSRRRPSRRCRNRIYARRIWSPVLKRKQDSIIFGKIQFILIFIFVWRFKEEEKTLTGCLRSHQRKSTSAKLSLKIQLVLHTTLGQNYIV